VSCPHLLLVGLTQPRYSVFIHLGSAFHAEISDNEHFLSSSHRFVAEWEAQRGTAAGVCLVLVFSF
jgi:hypothetical protein